MRLPDGGPRLTRPVLAVLLIVLGLALMLGAQGASPPSTGIPAASPAVSPTATVDDRAAPVMVQLLDDGAADGAATPERPTTSGGDVPVLAARLAALAVLLGAGTLFRRAGRSRAPTAAGRRPGAGHLRATPTSLIAATAGVLRV